ncbi:MAG: UDP-glucose 4-epimerase GalE [Nanoarchaeota archaeon]|nr:UDP-glucose 4-epimerase GalE [Nanoarchaeota archaeon]
MVKTILVTGGAGYIGSVAVKTLLDRGFKIIVVDNLSKGLRELVDIRSQFYELDLTDNNALCRVFEENKIDAVIHFAGYKRVDESMENAVKYSDNIVGGINLLNQMVEHGVKKMIFSSTCAVYGMPETDVADEKTPCKPINFYGYSKLAFEEILVWYLKVHKISYISLRYFNVAGDGGLYYVDPDAMSVIPRIMAVAFGKQEKLVIYGDDYDTRDGTGVRDYIDINDLVEAHIIALDVDYNGIINLGTANGVSVKEPIDHTEEVTGKKVLFEIGKRRKGDPACVLASNMLAKKILGWEPKRDIKEMIRSTYDAYKKLYQK